MRVLNPIKINLDLWLQRSHLKVLFFSLLIVAITMWLETGIYMHSNWHELKTKFHAMFLALTLGVMIHFAAKHANWCCPNLWIDCFVQNMSRIKFADFILRRLLYHLLLASQRLPKPPIDVMDPGTQQLLEEIQKDTFLAVQVFRRDANAILDRDHTSYIVPDEEEEEVEKAGFPHMLVSDELLRQLLGPYGEAQRSNA